MKRKLLMFVLVTLLGGMLSPANAQKTLDVSSFTRDVTDLTASMSKPVRDKDEGKLCALIKVETTLEDLVIRADALGYVQKEEHPGEMWVYVPYGAKSLFFSHEGYLPLQYQYTDNIEEGVVYRLRLIAHETRPAHGSIANTQIFVLSHYPDEATVIIDDMEVPTENGLCALMMSKGVHTYAVKASQFKTKEGEFTIEDQTVLETVKLEPLFGTFQLSTLPEEDFQVSINGQFVGRSPYKSERLDPGSYKVHISKRKYFPVDTVVRLREGDNLNYRVKLTSKADSMFYKRILGGRNVSFGVNAGYLFPFVKSSAGGGYVGSPINYSLGDSRENVSYSAQSGFTAGILADIRLYRNWYLITGANYTQIKYTNKFNEPVYDSFITASEDEVYKGDLTTNYEENYTYRAIDIPLLASYRFVITRASSVHLNLGGYASFGLSSKMKLSGSYEANGNVYARRGIIVEPNPISTFSGFSTHLNSEFDLYSDTFDFTTIWESSGGQEIAERYTSKEAPYRRFNYGLRAGITYELRGFQFGVSYNMQLSNMGQNEFWENSRIPIFNGQVGANNMSGYKHKIHSLEIKVGYIFRY
ncbi:MAG: outer membrane beta-barrel protein [Prevotella sp.]|nr:outer membrane beta-barrel protein [Prevotella sp.]